MGSTSPTPESSQLHTEEDPEVFQDASDKAATSEMRQLQSEEQEELLNALDKLRPFNINTDINVPQIVVCGDQSSGKSSVLGAIAGVTFPIGIGTVTRFATEVVLRRGAENMCDVELVPSMDRSDEHKRQIDQFNTTMRLEIDGSKDIAKAVEAVSGFLRDLDPMAGIWTDTLRVKLSGPSQTLLTIVDLPGLIHVELGGTRGDGARIKALVESYVNKPRTLVLAVVSALNDLQLQEIIDLVQGPVEERTLAVITKPDCLREDSDQEREIVRLVDGHKTRVGFGWHAVVNPPHEDKDHSPEHRADVERLCFSRRAWSHTNRQDLGIHGLREKLKRRLFESITTGLPLLMREYQDKLNTCKWELERLGPGRDNEEKQRQYVSKIMAQLQRLSEAGLEGDYDKAEFLPFFNGDPERGLRDFMMNVSDKFAQSIHSRGRRYVIYDQDSVKDRSLPEIQRSEEISFHHNEAVIGRAGTPSNVTMEKYCTALAVHMSKTRGKNLPGSHSTKTDSVIFRQQSFFWRDFADDYRHQSSSAVRRFLELAANHVAGRYTAAKLLSMMIYPALNRKDIKLDDTAMELLWPYQKNTPMTFNASFEPASRDGTMRSTIRCPTGNHVYSIPRSWAAAAEKSGLSMDRVTAAKAIDHAEAYYNIALNTFIDNMAILGVERCLLSDLPKLFDPDKARTLPAAEIAGIAAEPREDRAERVKQEQLGEVIHEVLQVCRKYNCQTMPPLRDDSCFNPDAPIAPSPAPSSSKSKAISTSSKTADKNGAGTSVPTLPTFGLTGFDNSTIRFGQPTASGQENGDKVKSGNSVLDGAPTSAGQPPSAFQQTSTNENDEGLRPPKIFLKHSYEEVRLADYSAGLGR